jgi:hypothetical protein
MKKTTFLPKVAALALVTAASTSAWAQLTVLAPGYGVQDDYIHPTTDAIVSYDWDASANLYYLTAAGYPNVNVWKSTGSSLTSLYSNPNHFAGASVVTIGNYVYFNDSDFSNHQFIRRYGPLDGSAATTLSSSTANFGLSGHAGDLFITGAEDFGTNHIYRSDLAPDGDLLNDPATDLGATSGASGPLAFDLEGNLYYAPGFGDLSIYKWSVSELAAAIANPSGQPLGVGGHLWLKYDTLYSSVSGATSLLLDGDGDLLITLTSFSSPSLLVEFGADTAGSYDGNHTAILSDAGRLGDLRLHDGGVFLSSGNKIVQVVPEPAIALLLLGALAAMLCGRSRKSFAAVAFALLNAAGAFAAGPYSSSSGVTAGAPDNPVPRSSLTVWETSVVNYAPAPGVGASFRSPSTGLASLGELYSPVISPTGTNSPFNKIYRPATGVEPNSFHNGSASNSPFGGDIHDPTDTYGFVGIDAPGSITLGFSVSIYNGVGADFAVFENGFSGSGTTLFAELAYVEVSSDGVNFARFDSISLNTAPSATAGTFQYYDVTNIYNLAGKHASNWGTPFDLDQLAGNALVAAGLLDISAVRYVRLVDVVGTGPLQENGSTIDGIARDSLGNPILDNWVTFDSGGFDYLGVPTGAVGVIHAVPEPSSLFLIIAGTGLLLRRPRRD